MSKLIPRKCAETKLEEAARRWLNSKGKDYDNGAAGAYKDLMHGGCASGIVGHLIYTSDTHAFFMRHAEEIGRMLAAVCDDAGTSPDRIFKDWDKSDPLALDINRNLLAWFGFEEAARQVAARAGIED